ncbi:GNAT family N-acetyltransferase [Aspergillus homomorphus CBS 101889]|uniref:N-acetyltransferase domain-containing protein n=1 Tax=Aspergillus homomorphus (strain CBS 101889) TaxID=1450537 RepID=A0A395HVI6_ASPHC|nr:hypothetical protein BO97DRAFT_346373 [Aspergillus homomorphus CBS 101889]RAL11810.1 hypothetical protein BO97DRAFT_346373 [Aspergillus homomorphus CBS 101889]
MPSLVICPVSLNPGKDWDDLIASYWASWLSPLQAVGELTFAHLGAGTLAEKQARAAVSQHLLQEAQSNPHDTVWMKCIDLASGRIVAGGMYKIHDSGPNPYEETAAPKAEWFPPESERRILAEELYRQLWGWRARLMGDKFVCGMALWVLPAYRSYGAARLLLEHFVERIDQLGMEAYLEGTEIALPLYRQCGFRVVSDVTIDVEPPQGKEPSSDWTRLVSDIQAHPVKIMIRPMSQKRAVDSKL